MIEENELKRCIKCGEAKGVDEYHADRTRKDGLSNKCKYCVSTYRRKYYLDNIEKINLHTKEYFKEHIDEKRAYNKKWKSKNKPFLREMNRNWHRKNKVTEYARAKLWRISNKDKVKELNKKYRDTLPDSYIKAALIRQYKVNASYIKPDFIEIKRIIIKTKRLCKTLKNSEAN